MISHERDLNCNSLNKNLNAHKKWLNFNHYTEFHFNLFSSFMYLVFTLQINTVFLNSTHSKDPNNSAYTVYYFAEKVPPACSDQGPTRKNVQ